MATLALSPPLPPGKKATMESVTDARCRQTYGSSLGAGVLCAVEVSGAVCNGDSGGFLGSMREGRVEQVRMV